MSKVLIIGGGAAGMMAGVFAARNHHEVHILEKNEKLGKKVFITGKGRCNVANACDTEELFPAVMSNPKFLYSGFYSFGPQDVMNFFEEAGVPLKVERGNRVFPQSDHSSDIIRALERELKKAGAKSSSSHCCKRGSKRTDNRPGNRHRKRKNYRRDPDRWYLYGR